MLKRPSLIENGSFLNQDKGSFYYPNPNLNQNPLSSVSLKSTPRISREEILELKKKYGRKK